MAAHDHDDLPTLVARLTRQLDAFDFGAGPMSDHQKLTVEALDCAKHGLFDEARHRLRLRDRPKFRDLGDCHLRYNAAMDETRAARAAQ